MKYVAELNASDVNWLIEAQGQLEYDKKFSDEDLRKDYEAAIQTIGGIIETATKQGVVKGRRKKVELTFSEHRQGLLDTAIEAFGLDIEHGHTDRSTYNGISAAVSRVYPVRPKGKE